MRSLTFAAMAAAALTAGVAHADVTENIDLTYSLNSTFVGSIVCTDDFSSILSVNGILNGYDPNGQGFQALGIFDPITADNSVSPIFNSGPDPATLFFTVLWDSGGQNWVDFGYSYDSSGITLTSTNNDVNFTDTFASGSVTPVSAPEPGTLTLFALGLFGLVVTRRRWTMSALIA
jgi:opacity protein-like surface antigen